MGVEGQVHRVAANAVGEARAWLAYDASRPFPHIDALLTGFGFSKRDS
jgi:hypothetical protein